MKHFKGYIITKNKSPIAGETFKNKTSDDLRTFEEVQNLSDYAGIIEDGYVIVDVDDKKQSEILFEIVKDLKLNTIVYKTTRGMHFYFKVSERTETNKVGTFTAIGLKVDMKLGSRNSYVCLKHNNVEREIIYKTKTIDQIPIWLNPISYTFPFLNMSNGDGRNQSLFNYILVMQSNMYTKAEIRETINLIGKYVLDEKLEQGEIDTILRDEAFNKPSFYGGKNGNVFLFDKFARFLISQLNIVRIGNQLHVYDNGIYVNDTLALESHMLRHIEMLTQAQRTEVLKYINVVVRENTEVSPANFIAFNNGIYNIIDDTFHNFSEEYIITNKIPWDYNPNAYSKLADDTLNKLACNDEEIRLLMEELIGYTFYRRNEMRKFFILTGDKSNGKSTFLRMVQNVLGDENISSLDLDELDDRFKTVEIFGKLANIGDDISGEYIRDPNQLKKLSAGNTVTVERKGEDAFKLNSYAKLVFAANQIPRINDPTGATHDRMIIIPFNARFSASDPDFDPFIRYKLEDVEVMEYLIKIGIMGLRRVLMNDGFTSSEQVNKELENYELENNPIKLFIKEQEVENIVNQTTKSVFDDYIGFCNANNLKPLGRIAFTRRICQELNLQSVNQRVDGRRLQVYLLED